MIDMDAAELRLRDRVHHAYDALDVRAPSTVAVLRHAQSRGERRGVLPQRAWIGVAVLGAAALVAVSFVGLQFVPRSAQVPQATLGGGQGPGGHSTGGWANSSSAGGAESESGQNAAQRQPNLQPCATSDLAVKVSTDHDVYGMGDPVTVTASVTNRGHVACLQPGWSSVWVSAGDGTTWHLCPESDWPPPSPTAVPPPAYGAAAPPAAHGALVPAEPSIAMAEFGPGQSESVVCTWHTRYRTLAAGTYRAWARWDGVSTWTSFTLLQLDPSPTPEPSPTPTATATPLVPGVSLPHIGNLRAASRV